MISVGSIYQLGRDAQTVASFAHTAFEHIARLQLFADYAQVDVFTFEGEGRSPCNDVKFRDPRERVDYFLGDSIGKVVVLRIGAHVEKRQYHNRINCRSLRGGARGG